MERSREREVKQEGYVEKLVKLNRVTKVVKGGKRFSFAALVVVGYGDGRVGYGFGKANDVTDAIRKATEKAKASIVTVPVQVSLQVVLFVSFVMLQVLKILFLSLSAQEMVLTL